MELNTEIKSIINKMLGEQNLYKIDPWRNPGKKCRHNNSVFCDKCRVEILKEMNNLTLGETHDY